MEGYETLDVVDQWSVAVDVDENYRMRKTVRSRMVIHIDNLT